MKFIKRKKLFKGMVFGLASVLCVGFVPFNALTSLAASAVDLNKLNTITLSGNPESTVVYGDDAYTIRLATYKDSAGATHKVGDKSVTGESSLDESSVTVTYKNTDYTIKPNTSSYDADGGVYGTFEPTGIGTYVITYSVTDKGEVYSYDYEVECEVAEGYFKFDELDEKVLPTVYDLSIFKEKGEACANIKLPIPTVYNDLDEPQDDVKFYAQTATAKTGAYVVVKIYDSNNENLKVMQTMQEDSPVEKDFYIPGNEFESLVKTGTKDYKITYTYYINGKFIAQTEKTLKVASEYYKDNNSKAGYELKHKPSEDYPTSAIVGVRQALPAVTGVTSGKEHNNEEVPVYYTVKAYYNNEKTPTEECIEFEDGRYYLNANRKGNYRLEYTITDFYGNQTKYEFRISDVKDTRQPTVFVYDANPDINKFDDVSTEVEKDKQDVKHGVYVSAEGKLKTNVTTNNNRNVVIYAVGAVDNYAKYPVFEEDGVTVKEPGLTLKRSIRYSNSGANLLEITDYNNYNLIFGYESTDTTGGDVVEFLSDNFAIRRDIEKYNATADEPNKVDLKKKDSVEKWLREHNYLIVTDDEQYAEDRAAAIEQGYAYIKVSSGQKINPFKDVTEETGFRIVYQAKDTDNTSFAEKYVKMTIKPGATLDTTAPTVTMTTSLQNAYLPDETIQFSEPKVSDGTDDERFDKVISYRYIDKSGNVIANEGVSESDDIQYAYTKTGLKSTVTGEKGWYAPMTLAKNSSNYVIKLANKPELATRIEIFVYAFDDDGNVGYYDKVIQLTEITDDKEAPKVVEVRGYTAPTEEGVETHHKQNESSIQLPTIFYSDANMNYMTAKVTAYRIKEFDQEGKLTPLATKETRSTSGMNAYAGGRDYVVDAGEFTPSRAGEYRVTVVAKDSANNSVVTFFDYIVDPVVVKGGAKVSNGYDLTKTPDAIELGEQLNLTTPIFNITTDSEETGYVWLDNDGVTATNYDIQVLDSPSSYKVSKTHFSATVAGTYKLQYNVYLLQYSKATVKAEQASAQDGDLYLKDGELYVHKTNGEFKVIVETAKESETGKAQLIAIKDGTDGRQDGNTLEALDAVLKDKVNFIHELFNKTVTVNYSTAPKLDKGLLDDIEKEYQLGENAEIDNKVLIPRISATYKGEDGIDEKQSKVTIVYSKNGSRESTSEATMENWKWNEGSQGTTEGGELYYTFSKDGTYTITYTVVGKNGTGSDTLSKTVLCGDTDNPTVKAEDGFLSFDGKVVNHKDTQVKITKEVGKTIKLSLNLDKLTLDDGDDTTREELLKQLKGNITLYNKTLQKYVSVVNEDGGSYEFAIEESGEYRLTIRSYDGANLPGEDIINFSVNPPEENATVNYQTIGTILIVVACVILAGVVVYFVYSKVKNDKANKKKS